MPRSLAEIKAHLRMAIANQSISTTLIQTEDLAALCDAADERDALFDQLRDCEMSLKVFDEGHSSEYWERHTVQPSSE